MLILNQMTNMLWVDQPVGTGFSQGRIKQIVDADGAKEFVSFFKNWEKLFGIQDYKIYLTGESYAGRYVPYIGAEMLAQQDKTYLDLSGALMYSPCIGDCGFVQIQMQQYPFAQANNLILNINETFLEELGERSAECGYTAYMDKYISYPPPGHQPPPPDFSEPPYGPTKRCNVAFDYVAAQQKVNPCFVRSNRREARRMIGNSTNILNRTHTTSLRTVHEYQMSMGGSPAFI